MSEQEKAGESTPPAEEPKTQDQGDGATSEPAEEASEETAGAPV